MQADSLLSPFGGQSPTVKELPTNMKCAYLQVYGYLYVIAYTLLDMQHAAAS